MTLGFCTLFKYAHTVSSGRNLISLLCIAVHSKTEGDIAKELEKWLCKLNSDILLSVSFFVFQRCFYQLPAAASGSSSDKLNLLSVT